MLHFSKFKITFIVSVCMLALAFAAPSFLSESARGKLPSALGERTVNLGLDLQGGSYLLLEVEFDAYFKEQMTNLLSDVRKKLRDHSVGYKDLKVANSQVTLKLRELDGTDVASMVREIDADLIVDEAGENVTIGYSEQQLRLKKSQLIGQSLEIVGRRVNETGTREPIIQRQGEDRILLQVPGLKDPGRLKDLLGKTAKLTFHMVNEQADPAETAAGIAPPGTRLISGDDSDRERQSGVERYAVFSKAELSGDMLVDAQATYSPDTGEPIVSFRFNSVGGSKFAKITTESVGKRFAVVLDHKVITAPVIQSPILGGSGIITGNFTAQSANDLALLLRAGALPAPLKILEERTVGPSLGTDSIEAGAKACAMAVALVMLFMFLNYGLFGLFSNLALLINGVLLVALMALFNATLTLPGIAGIVLTLGMAVDTNVLIFERMREEMRSGKKLMTAIESGFKMAFGTIMDAHITTFAAALLLFIFGTGTVKGFAVTLSVGIISSLFTAILVTRLLIVLWLRRSKSKTLPI